MGIDIEAKLMYGMDMIDIDDEFSEDIETGLENDVLQCASPFYDSPLIFWFIGFEISEGEVVAGKVDWEKYKRHLNKYGINSPVLKAVPHVW